MLFRSAHPFLEAQDLESPDWGVEGTSSFGKSCQAGAEETAGSPEVSDEDEVGLLSGHCCWYRSSECLSSATLWAESAQRLTHEARPASPR